MAKDYRNSLNFILVAFLLAAVFVPATSLAGEGERVEGRLVRKDTGEPVMGAPVRLDGEHFAVSSEEGVFHFDGVAPGWHRLSINDPECAPFEIRFEVVAGKPARLEYALDPRGKQEMEEVVIKSERLELEVSDTVLELDEVGKIPGTQGDVLKIVENLPGVARSSGAMGRGGGLGAMRGGAGYGIVVRGAAPEDSRVLIDDHEVPLLYHFGGLKSVLNSDILKRIDFLPGGFGAEYGMATGGIVDVQTRPCTHKQYDGYLELSMIDAGFLVKGPIGEDAGFIAAARRSTVDLWLPSVLEGMAGFEMTVAPTFYDYQLKLDWSPTAEDRLSLFAFGSDDRMEFLLSKPPTGDPSLRGEFSIGQYFHRLYLSWVHASPRDWQVKVSTLGGYDSSNISMGSASRYIRSDVPHLGLRADLEWQMAKRWKLKTGVHGILTYYDVTLKMPQMTKEGEVRGPVETMELIEGSEQALIYYGGVYASCAFKPADNMVLTGGLRAEGYHGDLTSDWAVMPRLSYKYEPWSGTIVKAGVGLYQQAPTEDELSDTMGNPALVMERAWHYSLGVEQELPFKSSLDLNVFYKEMDRLVSTDPDDNYENDGLGHAVGMEVLLRRDLADGLFGWLAYTFMRSERKDRAGEPWRLFDHDQTHILTLVAGYRLPTGPVMPNHGLRDGWEFGLRFQLVSGNPYTPMLGSVYNVDYDVYRPVAGDTNSGRLPLFHQLDLRVDYTWAFTTWALSLYLDVQNVYNHQNVEGVKYNYDYTVKSYYTGLPIIPALGIKGSF